MLDLPTGRVILHVDMDAFFAAVEQRDRPELRGKPVLVGGGTRGVVSTASYEARPFGCRSAMPMVQAMRLCPQAIVVKPRFEAYKEASRLVRGVFERFTPEVQPLSIDEAFLDVTTTWHLFAPGESDPLAAGAQIGAEIRRLVREITQLTCSVGVAGNKFLAKLASDMNKPDGLTLLRPEDVDRVLPPLPVTAIFGIGKAGAAALARVGVKTIADLRAADPAVLQRRFGESGDHWRELAFGRDDRPVHSREQQKSIGKERTFGTDVDRFEDLRKVLLGQVEHIARELREERLVARRVTLKLRRPDFTTFTRSATLDAPTDVTATLWATALEVFTAWWKAHPGPLRLLGASLHELTPADGQQLGLFAPPEVDQRQKAADAAADAVVAKFGRGAIRRGGSV